MTHYDRRTDSCPICGGGPLEVKFSRVVLALHKTDYCECSQCRSLVVPSVHWLSDVYDEKHADRDTGAAQRSIICSLFVRALRIAGVVSSRAKIIDFGAGNGLLVRLLRDQGFDAWGYDKHASMAVCRNRRLASIGADTEAKVDVITAIEVFEHLTAPLDTVQTLIPALANNGAILLRTSIYDSSRHNENWQYLEPTVGQHITFYSRTGLQRLAERCDLRVEFLPFGFHMLTRRSTSMSRSRKTLVFLLSGFQFLMARAVGLCDCSHGGLEKEVHAKQK